MVGVYFFSFPMLRLLPYAGIERFLDVIKQRKVKRQAVTAWDRTQDTWFVQPVVLSLSFDNWTTISHHFRKAMQESI